MCSHVMQAAAASVWAWVRTARQLLLAYAYAKGLPTVIAIKCADVLMSCAHAGGRGERLGLGAHGSSASAGLGDVYSSYRNMRSSSYHEMIVRGSGASNMAKGGS
jgi:hypothetical protein